MKQEKAFPERVNFRLTPTDRLTINRIIELAPSTLSDVIRSAVHTAFLLVQCVREQGLRLVLRNDKQKIQEDLDLTLISDPLKRLNLVLTPHVSGSATEDFERVSHEVWDKVLGAVRVTGRGVPEFPPEPESASNDVLQIRLTSRTFEELRILHAAGFATNRTTAVRRALELHFQIVSKTRDGARFGTISGSGEFTSLPILDLVYPEGRDVGFPRTHESFGGSTSTLVQLLFETLVSRQIETGKKLTVQNEGALVDISAGDTDAPRLFYVLSGWAEYSRLAAEIVQRLDSVYKREALPTLSLASSCFIETGMANFAFCQNRDADFDRHFQWVVDNASRCGAGADVLGTIHLVRARSAKRRALYAEALESTREAIRWYEKDTLSGMAAVARVTEAWLLMQRGDLREATECWEAAYECLKNSEDWTILGNIRFAQAKRMCHAGRESEAVSAMHEAIGLYSKCDPAHRNLCSVILDLANLQIRMASEEGVPTTAEELRKRAADNIRRADQLLSVNSTDIRNHGWKLLAQVNQILYGPHPLASKMRHLAQEAYQYAASHEDRLIMARARLKQATVERCVAAYKGCTDPISALLRAHEYASDAVKTASRLGNDRLSARIHAFLGNLFLESPFHDVDRASTEWEAAVRAMANYEDEDYLVSEIRALGNKLNSVTVEAEPAKPIFIVTGTLAFGQPLDNTVRAVERATIQAMAHALGSSASANRICRLLHTSRSKIENHLAAKYHELVVTESHDNDLVTERREEDDSVLFRVTLGLALTQPLDEILRAVEYAIVRAACIRYGYHIETICRILHAGHDRICRHLPDIETELGQARRPRRPSLQH